MWQLFISLWLYINAQGFSDLICTTFEEICFPTFEQISLIFTFNIFYPSKIFSTFYVILSHFYVSFCAVFFSFFVSEPLLFLSNIWVIFWVSLFAFQVKVFPSSRNLFRAKKAHFWNSIWGPQICCMDSQWQFASKSSKEKLPAQYAKTFRVFSACDFFTDF